MTRPGRLRAVRHGGGRRSPTAWPSGSSIGETTILVRYLDRQATVQLAFVPARPGFAWKDVPENNFIDRHVFAKLRSLRMQPSELCADSVFLRRAYLDVLGLLPTPDEAAPSSPTPRPTSAPG